MSLQGVKLFSDVIMLLGAPAARPYHNNRTLKQNEYFRRGGPVARPNAGDPEVKKKKSEFSDVIMLLGAPAARPYNDAKHEKIPVGARGARPSAPVQEFKRKKL